MRRLMTEILEKEKNEWKLDFYILHLRDKEKERKTSSTFTHSMSLRTHESNSSICFPMNHTKLLKYGAAVLK